MNRREFLKFSAMMTAAAATTTVLSCEDGEGGSPRYVKPEPWVRPGETLLLSNASVIDVLSGTVFSGMILLQNGRIKEVFHGDNATIAADRTLDLNGFYVTPGLINAHCHLSMPCTVSGLGKGLVRTLARQVERNAEECVKHGVTTVRDMAALSSQLHDLKVKIQDGDVVGPRMVIGYVLDVKGGYLTGMFSALGLLEDSRYLATVETPRDGMAGVHKALENQAGFIKIAHQELPFLNILPKPDHMDLKTAWAICTEARRLGLPVALHHTDAEGLKKGLNAGVTSFEHVVCDRAMTDFELLRLKRSGAYLIPTASVGYAITWETNEYSDGWDDGIKFEIARERARLMVSFAYEYCEDSIASAIETEYYRYVDPDYFDRFHLRPTINMDATCTILDYGVQNIKLMYDYGIPMGCGNDGGIPFDFPGALALEMAILEKSGFDPADILRMATVNNAKLLGLESDIGVIEAGKIGDLAVFEKNPLDTFANAFNPVMVFQDGELAFKG